MDELLKLYNRVEELKAEIAPLKAEIKNKDLEIQELIAEKINLTSKADVLEKELIMLRHIPRLADSYNL